MSRPEVLVVYKRSQLQLALDKRNVRIQRLLKVGDATVLALQAAHDAHAATLVEVERTLKAARVPMRRVYRARLRPAMCEGKLVISVGGDGTLLDTSHTVQGGAVLGVNSDTTHSVGFLCCAHRGNFAALLDSILADRWHPTEVRRLLGAIDGVPLPFPVLNDILLAHKNPAATSRYLIEHEGRLEDHRSSGVWISTPAGSTAALASAGGQIVDLTDERCQLRVREPFIADGPAHRLDRLWLAPTSEVVLTSKMREGRVYLDGPHEVLSLPTGARLALNGRAPPLKLYTTDEMARRRHQAQQNLKHIQQEA